MLFIFKRKNSNLERNSQEGSFNSFQSILQHFFVVCGQEDFSLLKTGRLCKISLGFERASRPMVPSGGAMKLSGPQEATNAVIHLDKESSCGFLSTDHSWGLPGVQGYPAHHSQSTWLWPRAAKCVEKLGELLGPN